MTKIFSGTRPITAAVGLSVDALDDVWVYFGTGRYLTMADRANADQQYMFGIRDPLFKQSPSPLPLGLGDLFRRRPLYGLYESEGRQRHGSDAYLRLVFAAGRGSQHRGPGYLSGLL